MQTTRGILFLAIVIAASETGCRSPFYADRGAGLGAVTGALAGAAIGEHNDNAAAGALIGTAVGALTGAAIGDAIDQDVARSQAIIEQQMGRRMAGAVSVPDAIAMTQAGLSEEVITTHIRANGVARPPDVNDLITLRNAGVSDTVVRALQQTPPPQPVVARAPAPIIVEEHYFGPPCPPPLRYHHHYPGWHHRHAAHPSVHWGFSFSN